MVQPCENQNGLCPFEQTEVPLVPVGPAWVDERAGGRYNRRMRQNARIAGHPRTGRGITSREFAREGTHTKRPLDR